MPAFSHHVFVCCNQREPGHSRGCCDPDRAGRLREALKAKLKQRNLSHLLARVNQAGCLDQCEYGPNLVIYPQGIWYGRVTLDDLDRIIEETIVGGRIIEELRIPDACLNSKGKVKWEPVAT